MKKIIHFYEYAVDKTYTAEQFINSCIYRYMQYRQSLKAVRMGLKNKRTLYKYINYFKETADSCELRDLGYEYMEFKFHKLSEKPEKYKWTKPMEDEDFFDIQTAYYVERFKPIKEA